MDKSSNLCSSSPSNSPIRLSEYLPHLLQFTLSLSVQGDQDLSRSLPPEYCAKLLQNEPGDACICLQSHEFKQDGEQSVNICDCICHVVFAEAVEEGVPVYPLYKQLATALYKSKTCGTFPRKNESMPGINEDETRALKFDEWMKIIVNVGSNLTDILERAKFHIDVQEPFFTQLRNGQKTVEGRCALGNYKRILPGDFLLVNRCLLLTVQAVNWYGTFYEMLEAESIGNVLPGIKTVKEGVQVYRRFYSEVKEKSGGVLAIVVSKALVQPYIVMSDMLTDLQVEGVRALLGFGSTIGTVPDALPPPRSVLMSSFSAVNNPNVQGNILTVGARALAKHVHRSSDGWWGPFMGKEIEKNKMAMEIISRIISHAQWMNIYNVHPNGCAFEIRVEQCYGARWSKDGKKFIGFLEPPMEDGHSRGWRH